MARDRTRSGARRAELKAEAGSHVATYLCCSDVTGKSEGAKDGGKKQVADVERMDREGSLSSGRSANWEAGTASQISSKTTGSLAIRRA